MTICDYVCSGPSLLKAAKKKFPNAKLFAYNPNGIGRRLKRILEKELDDNVNIIMEMKDDMKFCKIIMNPPYDKNLHLKILQEAMKYSDDIVNLSPIRWLQDPLAEYKKNSDWKKFGDIRKRIESLDVVSADEASSLFKVGLTTDLGIYHITNSGGWKSCYNNKIIDKIMLKLQPTITSKVCDAKKEYFCLVTTLDGAHKERKNAPEQTDFIRREHWYGKYYKTDGLISENGYTLQQNKERNVMSTNGDINTWAIVEFDTKEECLNYYAYTKTKFFKYLYINERVDVHIHPQFLPFMPTYKHKWTDEMLYQYFDLTQEEIDEIECSIN